MKKMTSFQRFLIIWVGELVSSIGSGLTTFALGAYVFALTGKASAVALVTLCGFLPSILLSPLAGILADRFDRRILMVVGDGLSVLGLVYMLIMHAMASLSLLHICIGVSISSVFTSLMEPAYKATITDFLPEEQFSRASGLVQMAGSAKYLLSPMIAGFLLTLTDISTIIILDISTLFVTVLAVMLSRIGLSAAAPPDDTHEPFFAALSQGLDALRERRGVIVLIVAMSVLTFFVGFVQTLFIPMILSYADTKTLGIVESVSAIGMLVSSLILGIVHIRRGYVQKLSLSLVLGGIMAIIIGATTHMYFILPAGFLLFACLPFANTSVEVLVRKNVRNEQQGRAWGLMGIITQLGYVAAYAISGPLADYVFNPLLARDGLLANSVGRIIGVGEGRGIGLMFAISGLCVIIYALFIPQIRSIRALEANPNRAK